MPRSFNSLKKKLIVFVLFAAAALLFFAEHSRGNSSVNWNQKDYLSLSITKCAALFKLHPKALARELELPFKKAGDKPLASLGISKEKLQHAISHILSHRPKPYKYVLYLFFSLWGIFYLVGETIRKDEAINWRTLSLILSVLMLGFASGKSPNPMEGTVKVFKTLAGLYPSLWPKLLAFLFFIFLAFIGNKIVCGWACPFGALQELAYGLSERFKKQRLKIPRWLSLLSRLGLFVAMLLLLFGLVGGRKGYVLYHPINPFNLFNFDIEGTPMWIVIVGSLVGGVIVYRPFCRLICPFGLVSFFVEKLSFYRIRVNQEACTNCLVCAKACPTDSAGDYITNSSLPDDCFSCARCLDKCPTSALRYDRH